MMKAIKTLGITVIAALMGMAFVGVNSAMAESTAFCAADPGTGPEEVCPESKILTHLHAVSAEGLDAAILTNIVDAECEVLYLGDTTKKLSTPLILKGKFTYENCETPTGGECSVTESGESEISLLKSGHDKATATLEALFLVVCGVAIHCTYKTAGMKGLFKGGLLPFTGEEEEFGDSKLTKESGFLCPKEAELDLLVFSLESFYITK